jgi:hypothetical protein
MSLRRSILGSLRRVVVVGAMLGLAAGPAPLSAATGGHCAVRHQAHAGHAGTAAQTGAVAPGMGAGMPGDCPHCASAECAVLAPCAGSVTAVGAAAMPALGAATAVRATAAPAAAGPTSLALAPPTPPPLPLS